MVKQLHSTDAKGFYVDYGVLTIISLTPIVFTVIDFDEEHNVISVGLPHYG